MRRLRAALRPSRLLTGGLVSVALAAGGAGAQAAQLPAADRGFVDQTVTQAMGSGRLPGFSIAISGPRGSYERAYGVANRATGTPLRLSDRVRIASITKSFTATAVLEQVQRGRLSLSAKLSRWVGGIPNGGRITVRELLAMRSGVYDYTSDSAWNRRFNANPLTPFKPSDAVAIIRRHKPLFPPGAKTQYADSNYILLGIILEKVTGRSVESVITRDVIERAGLRSTSFPTTPAMPSPFAHGYYPGENGKGRLRDYTHINPRLAWTAGGMVSTLGDLTKWGRVLAKGTLLSPRLQAERMRVGTIPSASGIALGYGLGITRLGDWVGHSGSIYGFNSETFYDPRNGAEITAATNLSSNFSDAATDLFVKLVDHLYPGSLRRR